VECVATDTKVGALIPQIIEPCLAAGDTATVRFSADLIAGSATRYDVAMYVATNGGSAQNGDMCYKDVLQPVAGLHGLGNPLNPLGTGPFKNDDNDSCGEVKAGVGAFYLLQQELKVQCVDANNDGVIDPISTCISWGHRRSIQLQRCDCHDAGPAGWFQLQLPDLASGAAHPGLPRLRLGRPAR
jgi:hypothetical protein